LIFIKKNYELYGTDVDRWHLQEPNCLSNRPPGQPKFRKHDTLFISQCTAQKVAKPMMLLGDNSVKPTKPSPTTVQQT
jgi:hypothetical protein